MLRKRYVLPEPARTDIHSGREVRTVNPSTLRDWFFPRGRLEAEWRHLDRRGMLFPETLDGLRIDTEFEFHERRVVILLIMVHARDGTLVREGLIGWLETELTTGELRTKQQRVPVHELTSAQRHGGQFDEVAA